MTHSATSISATPSSRSTIVARIVRSRASAALIAVWLGVGLTSAAAQSATTATLAGSSSNPITRTQSVTFNAFVAGGGTTPGGSVAFSSSLNGALGQGSLDAFAGAGRATAGGASHSCGLTAGGGAKCWGRNNAGQLGNGGTASSNVAVDVTGLGSGVGAITAGDSHSCAVTAAGGVKCWGSNTFGQLGNGGTTDSSVPVDVSGLGSGVIAIVAGESHNCALTAAGGVKCWGNNSNGQLGNGGTTSSNIPVNVTGLGNGVAAITASTYHSCTLTVAGGVKCWGRNDYGQLGNGGTTDSSTPVNVSGLGSGIAAIAVGVFHSCALTTAGGVKCWGRNNFGQLGNGGTVNSSAPVDVTGLGSGVGAIAAGGFHSCALTIAGGVKCWGYNGNGELGNGSTTSSNVPVDVSGLGSGVAAIARGSFHGCALTAAGGIKCWGFNAYGQLGDGTATTRTAPVDGPGFIALGIARASFTASALTTGAHTITVSYGGDGSHTSSSQSLNQVVRNAAHDFGNDTKSDILWRNSGGANAVWLMNGATVAQVASIGGLDTSWAPVGQRDFDGDGKADILWRNSSSGSNAIWFVNGTTVTSVASIRPVGSDWSIVGTADLDGDGKSDIVLRKIDGTVAVWLMNGATASSVAIVGGVGTNWSIVGVADFDGDGKGDLLWRETGGANAIWFMNGTAVSSIAAIGAVGTNWSVAGTGDLNGDGCGDIIWRETNGAVAAWLMNGTTVSSAALIGGVGTNWSVASNGDYDGDGKGDIIWRESGGAVAAWLMNGTTVSSVALIGGVGTNWSVMNAGSN